MGLMNISVDVSWRAISRLRGSHLVIALDSVSWKNFLSVIWWIRPARTAHLFPDAADRTVQADLPLKKHLPSPYNQKVVYPKHDDRSHSRSVYK